MSGGTRTSSPTLRLSVTTQCQYQCVYCGPAEHAPNDHPRNGALAFEDMVRVAAAFRDVAGQVAVRITGGEPLMRPELCRLVSLLASEGIADIALTTNGRLLAPYARGLREAGLTRVNVSLDSLDRERFATISGGRELTATLQGLEAALEAGLEPIKLNAVVLRGINDHEVCALMRFAIAHRAEMRFIELMPIGVAADRHAELFVPNAEVRDRLADEFVLTDEDASAPGPAQVCFARCASTGVTGRVGFISPMSDPFCDGCRRLRLTSQGKLRSCLRRGGEIDVLPLLRTGGDPGLLRDAIRDALRLKQELPPGPPVESMAAIGG